MSRMVEREGGPKAAMVENADGADYVLGAS